MPVIKFFKFDIKKEQLGFYIPFTIWFTMNILVDSKYENMSAFSTVFLITNIICIAIIGLYAFTRRMNYKRFLLTAFCAAAVLLSALFSHQFRLLFIFLFIFCAADLDGKTVIKYAFMIEILAMIFILLSCAVGILSNDTILRLNGRSRYYLGYNYTTLSANYLLHMTMMWLYVKPSKLGIKDTAVISVLNIIFYVFTNTRAVFILIFLLLACVFAAEHMSCKFWKNKIINFLFGYQFVIAAIMSLLLIMCFFSDPFMWKLNSLLVNRLYLGNTAFKEYGLSLFGQNISWNMAIENGSMTAEYMYVDCAYMNIALNFGIVILALLCAGFTVKSMESLKTGNYTLTVIFFILAFHSITDPQLYMMWYNPFLLLLGTCFTDDSKTFRLYCPKEVQDYLRYIKENIFKRMHKQKSDGNNMNVR